MVLVLAITDILTMLVDMLMVQCRIVIIPLPVRLHDE